MAEKQVFNKSKFQTRQDRQVKRPVIMPLAIIVFISLYAGGLVTQLINNGILPRYTEWGYRIETQYHWNIIHNITFAVRERVALQASLIIFVLLAAFFFIVRGKKTYTPVDKRGFGKSTRGTYGTADFMSELDASQRLDTTPIGATDKNIFGTIDGQAVTLSDQMSFRLNKNIAVYGAPGTGKSRAFARPMIYQCSKREESMIITDPKGELYNDMSLFLKTNGYTVKVFNLVEVRKSDAWNPLMEATSDPDNLEANVQTFVQTVINNTVEDGKSDKFYDNSAMNLLKALCLYTVGGSEKTAKNSEGQEIMIDVNLSSAYRLLYDMELKDLGELFDALKDNNPAKAPWQLFINSSKNLSGNIVQDLGVRLQVMQDRHTQKMTSSSEIDLKLPGKEKCAYFVITSDQDNSRTFLSSLFFSFLFIKLVGVADARDNGRLEVPVNFIMDEFPNIGEIPDFKKKISTVRSRGLNIAIIFQSIAQLKDRYPGGQWEEILGNCDVQLFLGANDQETSRYVSDRSGEMTVVNSSVAISRDANRVIDSQPNYRESLSDGKRKVLTMDEVLTLDTSKALLIVRASQILMLDKMDYTDHPMYDPDEPKEHIRTYIPSWVEEERKNDPTYGMTAEEKMRLAALQEEEKSNEEAEDASTPKLSQADVESLLKNLRTGKKATETPKDIPQKASEPETEAKVPKKGLSKKDAKKKLYDDMDSPSEVKAGEQKKERSSDTKPKKKLTAAYISQGSRLADTDGVDDLNAPRSKSGERRRRKTDAPMKGQQDIDTIIEESIEN